MNYDGYKYFQSLDAKEYWCPYIIPRSAWTENVNAVPGNSTESTGTHSGLHHRNTNAMSTEANSNSVHIGERKQLLVFNDVDDISIRKDRKVKKSICTRIMEYIFNY